MNNIPLYKWKEMYDDGFLKSARIPFTKLLMDEKSRKYVIERLKRIV
jgi:hypothetical protein